MEQVGSEDGESEDGGRIGSNKFVDENSWLVVLGSKAQHLSISSKCKQKVSSQEKQTHNSVSMDLVMCSSSALCTNVVCSECESVLDRIS